MGDDRPDVATLKLDQGMVKVINDMWSLDPKPAESVGLWEDIRLTEERGDVKYAHHPNGNLVGYYFCAPYAAI